MTKDFIGYRALTDAALRSVVREALKRVEKQGLIGAHHFRLTFKTHFPGVEIPDFLCEQYPDEMTIILQHQYWGLKVKENHFEVTLTFRKVPAALAIPFHALTAFVDPGVQFGLQFQPEGDEGEKGADVASVTAALPAPEKPNGDAKPSEKPVAPGEVVSLDSFRKK
ncbi:MAG TPA: ClpXP protease specificity-enhancing factor SspB [Rhizomicrobium sp.]